MWPTQPPESEAKEENIALYFFAKDLERFKVLLYGDYNASLHGV
jgi:hypothetical protein